MDGSLHKAMHTSRLCGAYLFFAWFVRAHASVPYVFPESVHHSFEDLFLQTGSQVTLEDVAVLGKCYILRIVTNNIL